MRGLTAGGQAEQEEDAWLVDFGPCRAGIKNSRRGAETQRNCAARVSAEEYRLLLSDLGQGLINNRVEDGFGFPSIHYQPALEEIPTFVRKIIMIIAKNGRPHSK